MKIEIKITKEVLRRSMWCGVDNSKPRSQSCAIAVAIRDIFPSACVGFPDIALQGRYKPRCVKLPNEALSFIRDFDMLVNVPEKRLNFPEFSFEIDVPDEVIERIGIEEAKAILERSETLNLVEE